MLISLVLIPIVTALLVACLKTGSSVEVARVKQVALMGTLVEALVSVLVAIEFDLSLSGYQMQVGWTGSGLIHLSLGVDGLSLIFVLLTTLLVPVCLLAS